MVLGYPRRIGSRLVHSETAPAERMLVHLAVLRVTWPVSISSSIPRLELF
jgi:hypothetical protein